MVRRALRGLPFCVVTVPCTPAHPHSRPTRAPHLCMHNTMRGTLAKFGGMRTTARVRSWCAGRCGDFHSASRPSLALHLSRTRATHAHPISACMPFIPCTTQHTLRAILIHAACASARPSVPQFTVSSLVQLLPLRQWHKHAPILLKLARRSLHGDAELLALRLLGQCSGHGAHAHHLALLCA